MIDELKRQRINNHHWYMVQTVGRKVHDGTVSERWDGTHGLQNALSIAATLIDDNESVLRIEIFSSIPNPHSSGRLRGPLVAVIDLNGLVLNQ
jgi:hypothetical protein